MNDEQKYKEVLERAKYLKENTDSVGALDISAIFEYIFPELKESEDDRIRKELITYFRNTRCVTEEGAERIVKWIAWFEKQGEQKSVVKIEPIKEGLTDFQRCVSCLIASVMNKEYDYTQGFVEWAAQTLLGYAKHEIKTAWREEDENMLNDIIRGLKSVEHLIFTHNAQGRTQLQGRIDWLKSLKERYAWKPSDEQMEALERMVNFAHFDEVDNRDKVRNLLNTLKTL